VIRLVINGYHWLSLVITGHHWSSIAGLNLPRFADIPSGSIWFHLAPVAISAQAM
jgi:hypothetical protein